MSDITYKFVNSTLAEMKIKKQLDVIFTDVEKVLDRINHLQLLRKLSSIGVSKNYILPSYILQRKLT